MWLFIVLFLVGNSSAALEEISFVIFVAVMVTSSLVPAFLNTSLTWCPIVPFQNARPSSFMKRCVTQFCVCIKALVCYDLRRTLMTSVRPPPLPNDFLTLWTLPAETNPVLHFLGVPVWNHSLRSPWQEGNPKLSWTLLSVVAGGQLPPKEAWQHIWQKWNIQTAWYLQHWSSSDSHSPFLL